MEKLTREELLKEYYRKEKLLRDLIQDHEKLTRENRAQSVDAKDKFEHIQELCADLCIEFCAHNLALLGSTRYECDTFEGINELLTPYQYKRIMKERGLVKR